jgi:hypothetical protein
MITRIHKINEKNRDLKANLNALAKHLRASLEETKRLQNVIKEIYEEIGTFKGMTDEEFNKTKYRKEEF